MTPRRHMVSPLLCAAVLLLGLLAGCGSADTEKPQAAEETTDPERPEVGQCHDLSAGQVLESADTEEPVDCSKDHTSETVFVGTFKPAAQGEPSELTDDAANQQASATCRGKAAQYLGATEGALQLTQVEVFWFVPTLEEVDAGAKWLRCDVVVLERENDLMQLPESMKGALKGEAGLEEFGLCGTARPGDKNFERVVCSKEHAWRAISTVGIGGSEKYPGTASVRGAGEEECESQARAAQGSSLEYEYGWEWPTKAQWEAGQRYGLCWVPA